jgi:two-component system, NarL family, nitrate/nitrite response regulator NarL
VKTLTELVLGDDHTVFLDALSAVLTQRGFTVRAAARSAAETVKAVHQVKPDVCLIDRHFVTGDDGIDAIGKMLAASPGTSVLVLSADRDNDGVMRALAAGASGYLHKTRGIGALASAIDRVTKGEVVVDVPVPLAARRSVPPGDPRRLAGYLTARERECLGLLVQGMSTAAMVTVLGVSRTTVRTHVQALLTKLGVHSRLEAASFAVRYGLLDNPAGATEAPAM